jgi:hypothetical protein
VISHLSGALGVREIFFDSRIKCRGIAPISRFFAATTVRVDFMEKA